ncbi:nucleoside-diphosphate kinase [Rummeliibacillus stabekisii]|uniref:nucleoside-diphosphate kinase n=1 Tax=Rummeliibacillus stabekisii TaxID=241244 RepID=UPI00371AACE3
MDNSMDYGLAILKPDGVIKPKVYDSFKRELEKNNLEIVFEKRAQLQKKDILSHFSSPFNMDEYADYLSSGEIISFLVRGHGASHKLREIKLEFRKEYGFTSNDMRNLLHTADHGNEYNLQFKLLFPSCNIVVYSQYADLTVKLNGSNNEILNQLLKIDQESNLKHIGLLCEDYSIIEVVREFNKLKSGKLEVIMVYVYKTNFKDINIELLGYLPLKKTPTVKARPMHGSITEFFEWIRDNEGLVILNYLPLKNISSEMLNYLKALNLCGVQVYDPRRTLTEAEILEDIVEDDFGLFVSGGTNGFDVAGAISIGKYEFNQLTNLYLPEEKVKPQKLH